MTRSLNAEESVACAEAIAALRSAPDAAVPDQHLEPFLTYAWRIVRNEIHDDEFVDSVRTTIPAARAVLVDYLLALDEYITAPFYGDEWREACARRSKLEAVRTLWADELGGLGAPYIDCETVDDLLQQKGQHEGHLPGADIPAGTPSSHWWWWYPDPPPA